MVRDVAKHVGEFCLISCVGKGENSNVPPMNYPVDENLFYSAPSQPLASSLSAEGQEIEQTAYEEPAAEEITHPPDFKPFFTLIEDPETGEHHHPTVHYVFSDDDPEILTNASLEALDTHTQNRQRDQPAEMADERYVIVDMAADGRTVTSASSLSKDWQAVRASITQAPSWGENNQTEDRGLMLKISGKESRRADYRKERRRSLQGAHDVETMVAAFGESLNSLDEVLGSREEVPAEPKDVE